MSKRNASGYLLEAYRFCFQAVFWGWLRVLYLIMQRFFLYIKLLTPLWLMYMTACLAMVVLSLLPWFSYQLDFFADELYIGSSLRWLFLGFAGLNIIGSLFHFTFRQVLFITLFLVIGGLYIVGIFYPNQVHINITNRNDYSFLPAFWLYGFALASAFVSCFGVLGCPLFSLGKVKEYMNGSEQLS